MTVKPAQRIRYKLCFDQLEDKPYWIERIEVVGEFVSREEARQYMIDNEDERRERDAG